MPFQVSFVSLPKNVASVSSFCKFLRNEMKHQKRKDKMLPFQPKIQNKMNHVSMESSWWDEHWEESNLKLMSKQVRKILKFEMIREICKKLLWKCGKYKISSFFEMKLVWNLKTGNVNEMKLWIELLTRHFFASIQIMIRRKMR